MSERVPERRISRRIPTPGQVALAGPGREALGQLRDASAVGIGVVLDDPGSWCLGAPVHVTVRLADGELFEAVGWVARYLEPEGTGVGIGFDALEPEPLAALACLVEAREGKPKAGEIS